VILRAAPRAARLRARGMSLIELLVVVAVLAVVAGIAVIGLSGAGGSRELEREARRLQSLLALACERAALGGREHGIALARRGYAFQLPTADGWRVITEGELRPRELPRGFRLGATRDGLELELEDAPGAEPQSVCAPGGELLPFEARIAFDGARGWTVRALPDARIEVLAPESTP
jgi:general secretion pathway protein H